VNIETNFAIREQGVSPAFYRFFQFVSSVYGSAALILPRLGRCKLEPKKLIKELRA